MRRERRRVASPRPREGRREAHLRLGRFREERIRRNPLSVTRRVVVVRDKRVLAGCVRRRRRRARAGARRRERQLEPQPGPRRVQRLQSRRVEDGDARAARARDHRGGPRRGAEQCRRERAGAHDGPREGGRLCAFAFARRVFFDVFGSGPREEHAERGRARARGEHRLPRPRLDQPCDARHRRARVLGPRAREGHHPEPLADEARFRDGVCGICGIRFLRRLRRSSSVCLRRSSSAARDVGVLRGRRRREEPPLVQPNRRRVGERAERARRQRGMRGEEIDEGVEVDAHGVRVSFSARFRLVVKSTRRIERLRESPSLRAVRAGHPGMDAAREDTVVTHGLARGFALGFALGCAALGSALGKIRERRIRVGKKSRRAGGSAPAREEQSHLAEHGARSERHVVRRLFTLLKRIVGLEPRPALDEKQREVGDVPGAHDVLAGRVPHKLKRLREAREFKLRATRAPVR